MDLGDKIGLAGVVLGTALFIGGKVGTFAYNNFCNPFKKSEAVLQYFDIKETRNMLIDDSRYLPYEPEHIRKYTEQLEQITAPLKKTIIEKVEADLKKSEKNPEVQGNKSFLAKLKKADKCFEIGGIGLILLGILGFMAPLYSKIRKKDKLKDLADPHLYKRLK